MRFEPCRTAACLYVHYTGWLTDGTKFDSSTDTTAVRAPGGAPQCPPWATLSIGRTP